MDKLTIDKPVKGLINYGVLATHPTKHTSYRFNASHAERDFAERAALSLGMTLTSFARQVIISAAEAVLQERITDGTRREAKSSSGKVRGPRTPDRSSNRTRRKRKDNNHEASPPRTKR